jgi:hypothetical protein
MEKSVVDRWAGVRVFALKLAGEQKCTECGKSQSEAELQSLLPEQLELDEELMTKVTRIFWNYLSDESGQCIECSEKSFAAALEEIEE